MKNVFFIAAISLILFASCQDNKKVENVENVEEQNTQTTLSPEEMSKKEDSLKMIREENRIVDSVQQVKEHGHAH